MYSEGEVLVPWRLCACALCDAIPQSNLGQPRSTAESCTYRTVVVMDYGEAWWGAYSRQLRQVFVSVKLNLNENTRKNSSTCREKEGALYSVLSCPIILEAFSQNVHSRAWFTLAQWLLSSSIVSPASHHHCRPSTVVSAPSLIQLSARRQSECESISSKREDVEASSERKFGWSSSSGRAVGVK